MNKRFPPSGYYYPNRIARIYLRAMEEVMGRNGLNALLNLTGLEQYKEQFPPNNLDKEFDFAGMGPTVATAGRIFKGQKRGTSGEEGYLAWERFQNMAMLKVNLSIRDGTLYSGA